MRYADRVTIITGGSRGIGAGCVRVFAEAGAGVVFCSPDAAEGRRLEAALAERFPGRVWFVPGDVTKTEELHNLVEQTVARYGRLDCLINNAGWHPPHRPIDDFSLTDFRALLELNLVSVFAACQLALPHLRRTQGNIINMASLVGTMGQLHATTYVAAKGAVIALTKALAIDEAAHGVRVNSVSPGNIYTPLWQEAIDASADPQRTRADGEAAQLLGRMGTAEEAGRLCLFIAAEASFTTGVDHLLSGGAELGYGRKTRQPQAAAEARSGQSSPPSVPRQSITSQAAGALLESGPQRRGQLIRLRPEKYEDYRRLHAEPWPEVLATLRAAHIRNYSIYHKHGLLFAYFEYAGQDFAGDMARIAADPKTHEWWALTDPCQQPMEGTSRGSREGGWWADMEELFHMD
jgi:NAD(P)-dependent dehydrogenase (short-subunit alcohol dehydrogenase family)/L-rhamnose mutarotase